MGRFSIVALLIACLLAVGAPGGAQESDQQAHPDPETVAIEVVDGRNDEFTVTIDADLYLPSGVTAASSAPVVIAAHGFGGTKASEQAWATLLRDHGYVVLAYSSRGFGATTGEIGLDSIHYDVKDVRQILDWLAERPEVLLDAPGDPRVGMIGPSYGGGIQLQVAAVDDRVDAIVPLITWHSLVSSLQPNGRGTGLRLHERPDGVFKQSWTSLFFASGTTQPVASPDGSSVPPGPCLGFVDGLCQAYAEAVAQGRASQATIDLLGDSSPAARLDGIATPTFLIQGMADTLFTPNEAAANFTALRARGVPVKMLWTDGGHGYPDAEGERAFWEGRVLAWYARHLRDDAAADPGPPFEYYRTWASGTGAERYAASGVFPPGGERSWFLSADGTLATTSADAVTGAVTFTSDPARLSHREVPNFQTQEPAASIPVSDPAGSFTAFATEPLEAAVTLVGVPTLRFAAADALGQEVQVFGKLVDVAPDGTETLLRRQAAPIRTTEPDAPISSELVGMAHRFEEGHRIKLVLASTDDAFANRRTPTQYTLSIEPGDAWLRLPVLEAPAGAGRPVETGGPATGPSAPAGTGGGPALPATGSGLALLALAAVSAALALRRR